MANTRFIDFIGDIVDTLRQRASIIGITNPTGTTYVVEVSDLLDLVVNNTVFIGGVEYTIKETDSLNSTFTVVSATAPVGTEYKTGYPYYYHGTFIATDNELKKKNKGLSKYPIIYLAETYSDRENLDPMVQIGDTYNCSIFVMNSANYRDDLTDGLYTNVIDPMDALATLFIAKIKANPFVQYKEFSELERIRYAKWGLFVETKGGTANLFTDNLGGVELRLEIPLRKSINGCGRYADLDFNNCAGVTIFKDNVYEQTVASGNRFDYSGGGDVDVEINGTPFDTVTAPGSLDIPVLNTNGDAVGTVNAGVNVIIADDSVTNSDASVTVSDIVQGVPKILSDVVMTKPDGTTESYPSMKAYSCTQINVLTCAQLNNTINGLTQTQRNLIQRVYYFKNGNTILKRTGDDAYFNFGGGVDFFTLDCNNPFGNTKRFTDELGGQTYTNNVMVDWRYGWMYSRNLQSAIPWDNAIDDALLKNDLGFSDWRLPPSDALYTILQKNVAGGFGYTELNVFPANQIWSSTPNGGSATAVLSPTKTGTVSGLVTTGSRQWMYGRPFTFDGTNFG